jgi:hypothetical protein
MNILDVRINSLLSIKLKIYADRSRNLNRSDTRYSILEIEGKEFICIPNASRLFPVEETVLILSLTSNDVIFFKINPEDTITLASK